MSCAALWLSRKLRSPLPHPTPPVGTYATLPQISTAPPSRCSSCSSTHLKLHVWQWVIHALPVLIHHLNAQPSTALGTQVVVNQVLLLQVALADAARVVLAQRAAIVPAA